jgi:hypothetical protein
MPNFNNLIPKNWDIEDPPPPGSPNDVKDGEDSGEVKEWKPIEDLKELYRRVFKKP